MIPDGQAFVRTRADGAVRHVELHRPDRLNAVSEEVYAGLESALDAAAADPDIGAVLLTGAGRSFCAGADLKAHAERRRDAAQRRAYVWAGQRVCRLLQRLPVPVVAAVQGHAIGAGAELAVSCDVIVCADDARLRFPEVALGTFVGGGASHRLPRLVGELRAKELLLLGRELTGVEAVAWGLATEAVPAADLLARATAIATLLASQPRRSTRLAKHGLSAVTGLDEALVHEAEGLLACMADADWGDTVARFGGDRAEPAP